MAKLADNGAASHQAPSKARFRLGVVLFGIGLICPVFVPLVTSSTLSAEWKTGLSGLLMLGIPEVLWVAAAAVMGKAGFEVLKKRLFGLLKRHALPTRVSPLRYRIGLVLFLCPLMLAWLGPYTRALLPWAHSLPLSVHLAGDLVFLASLLVLGGEFWEKLGALFRVEAGVQSGQRK